MEAAFVIRWGARIPGREALAEEVFGKAVAYFAEIAAKKQIDSFEPFFFKTGEVGGFILIKGEEKALAELQTTYEFRELVQKANYLVGDFRIDYLYTGAQITELMTLAGKVRADLGLGF